MANIGEKWVYITMSFFLEDEIERMIGVMRQAKAAGATHIQLNDYQFGMLSELPPYFFRNVRRFKAVADELGLVLVPAVCSIGMSGRYLYHDPNLADGLPVKDVRFVVKGGKADVDPTLAPKIANAGFDRLEGEGFAGWRIVEPAGKRIFHVDTKVRNLSQNPIRASAGCETAGRRCSSSTMRSQGIASSSRLARQPLARPRADRAGFEIDSRRGGNASLRATRPDDSEVDEDSYYGVMQTIAVKPFHLYRVVFHVKAEDTRRDDHPIRAVGSRDGRLLSYQYVPIKAGQDWTRHTLVFNSLDYDKVDLYVGCWPLSGTLWFDDVSIEPVGLLNVLRREYTPLKVTSADGKTVYHELIDFKYVEDRKLGRAPSRGDFMMSSRGTFDAVHEPPLIELTANSRIRDGEIILVSFYSPAIIYVKQQVTTSMSDPRVIEMLDDEFRRVHELFNSGAYFLGHDEIRSGGWEEQPGGAHLTPGQLLADQISKIVKFARKYAPDARLHIWSDMFDPNHNAKQLAKGEHRYFANGSWYGSWEGLPSDVWIHNWHWTAEGLKWFADRGHRQIMSLNFDSGPLSAMDEILERVKRTPNVGGYQFTTWGKTYDNLPEFFTYIEKKLKG